MRWAYHRVRAIMHALSRIQTIQTLISTTMYMNVFVQMFNNNKHTFSQTKPKQ